MRALEWRACVLNVRAILERVYWALGRRPRAVCDCGARSRFGACPRLARCAGKRSRVSSASRPERGSIPWTGNKKVPTEVETLDVTSGGDEGNRTPDLLTASQALSQLSYAPKQQKRTIRECI